MSTKTSVEADKLKPQLNRPPAEAVHVARMLSDSSPADFEERIQQVAAVVSDRSEDEISIALHDNDYDPEKAAAALLDEDNRDVTGEWTVTAKRGKKKSESEDTSLNQVVTNSTDRPKQEGQKHNRKHVKTSQRGGLSDGTAADVVIIEQQKSYRGRSRYGQTSSHQNRSRYKSDRGRFSRGRGQGRRGRGSRGDGSSRNGGRPVRPAPLSDPSSNWDMELVPAEIKQDNELEENWGSPGITSLSIGPVAAPDVAEEEWEVEEVAQIHTLEIKSAVPSTVIAPPVSKATRTVQFSVEEDKGERMTKAKPKRATRSKIPTDPVEMPTSTMDELGLQFGNLGIGFGDTIIGPTEPEPEPLQEVRKEPVVSDTSPPVVSLASPKQPKEEFPSSLTVSETKSSSNSFPPTSDTPSKLEPPPGLSKPVSHQVIADAMSYSSALPQSRGFAVASESSAPQHLPKGQQGSPLATQVPTSTPSSATSQLPPKLQESFSKTVSTVSAGMTLTLPSTTQTRIASSSVHQGHGKPTAGGQPQQVLYPHHQMMPPYMMHPPHAVPYFDSNMYYHHVSSSEYPPMSRGEGGLIAFGDSKSRDVTSPSSANQQHQQGTGLQQGQPHPYMNTPFFPYYGMGVYPIGPYSQQMSGMKPGNQGNFPGGQGSAFPVSTSTFGNYEEMGGGGLEYHRPFGSATQGKNAGGNPDTAFKQFDGKQSAINYNVPPMGGSATAAQYGYVQMPPTYPYIAPMPQGGGEGSTGTNRQTIQPSKHTRNYPAANTGWGGAQGPHSTSI